MTENGTHTNRALAPVQNTAIAPKQSRAVQHAKQSLGKQAETGLVCASMGAAGAGVMTLAVCCGSGLFGVPFLLAILFLCCLVTPSPSNSEEVGSVNGSARRMNRQ